MDLQIVYWVLLNSYRNVDDNVVKASLKKAFNEWERYFKIQFIEDTDKSEKMVDYTLLEISFHCGKKSLCKSAFDGKGKVLAHGTKSEGNILGSIVEIHFDCDEDWLFDETITNIFSSNPVLYITAIHEIGHCLGLNHSSVLSSIMYPSYSRMKYELSYEDILEAKKYYKLRDGVIMPKQLSIVEAFLRTNWINVFIIVSAFTLLCVVYKGITPFFIKNHR